MDSDRYNNNEIDLKHQAVLDKLDNLQNVVELRVGTFEIDTRGSLSRIEAQVSFTNGKVRKIIIGLVLLSGIVIGQNFTSAHDIINLLFHAL